MQTQDHRSTASDGRSPITATAGGPAVATPPHLDDEAPPGQTAAARIVTEFLNNTAPEKIAAAAERWVAEDATYISLNFDNPDLKRVLPWTGIRTGRDAYTSTFIGVATYWTVERFDIADLFGAGENVAVFGSFTYRSNTRGKSFTSPFSVHAKVKDGRIVHFMFMEDTFASCRSFSSGGTWTIRTDPNGPEFQV